MRYLIAFAAIVCLAGNAFASAPIKGLTIKGGHNPGGGYTAKKDQPADPATTPGTCDHAINTKGTGAHNGRMANPNGTGCNPNPNDALKTRTKSNSTNE
jgi:hypothetical protein